MALHITDANAEEILASDKLVVIDFWGTHCGPCMTLAPVIEELSEEFEGKAIIGKYNVDDYSDLSTEYSIRNIPTMLFFKGGELKERNVGSISKADLAKKIDALL